jgi:hypothetical protein
VVFWHRCVASEPSAEDSALEWVEQVIARVLASGGQVLAGIGATVVAAFDNIEVVDAVELARSVVDDASRAGGALKVDIGIALGEIEEVSDNGKGLTYRGSTLDRAQVLANRARAGEVVLDQAALAAASETFLFAREVAAGSVRGRALDPTHPCKAECRRALTQLKPAPIASSVMPVFEALRTIAQQAGPKRVVIRCGSASAPLDLIDRLALTVAPTIRLRVSRKAGGLQPLGGLELAMRRLWPDETELDGAGLPASLRARLKTLLRGQSVQRSEMVETLSELLRLQTTAAGRPWLVLDQVQEIDPATLGVVAEVAAETALDFVLFMTLPLGVAVPTALVPEAEVQELTIPSLKLADRRTIAEAILSLEEGSEVSQRVAILGGETATGVLEAARTLVSAGDLVLRGKSFAFRTGPRSGVGAVPIEALITERAMGLAPDAYRVLEALCVAPPDVPRELIAQVVQRDGLGVEEVRRGLAQLMNEGFVDDGLSLGSADATVRGSVRNSMPPARAAELHRFVAEVLREQQKAPGFGSAQLAYHLAEGGLEADAASALIESARAAAEYGFARIALRLLATAVELDGSPEVRKTVSEVAQAVEAAAAPAENAAASRATGSERPQPLAAPPSMADGAIRSAIKALCARDYDAVERWLDTAIAAGWGRAAAQRILAMAQLARGELQDATLTLSRTNAPDAPAEVRARDALCWALLRMQGGEPALGVRDALDALAASRRLADTAGQSAALHVLAHGYRMLDREPDALRIEATENAL